MLEPSDAIDRINQIYGSHPHHRALHARGTFYTGTFTASPEATALCAAAPYSGDAVPVLVRWSNGGGDPDRPDQAQDVRGMAVKFQAPGGDTDLLGQTSPRFPMRTPEEFLSMTAAAQRPATFPIWMLRHPRTVPALLAGIRAKSVAPPFSYAEVAYYPIHAYGWIAADGSRSWVRHVFQPMGDRDQRPEGEFDGRERLTDELAARLAAGPVRYDVRVTVAGPDDDPHDPTSVWTGARELSAGVIEVTTRIDDPEQSGGLVVFDPTRVVDSITLSDDPILRYRGASYGESIARRTS
jgi:catalase